MNVRELETFVWAVRLGGIGAAARHLNLTQPAATRRIQELEKDIGAKVFRPQGRQLVLTAVGESCFAIAERILADVTRIRLIASGGAAFEGTVRVGVGEAIAVTWLHAWLKRIAASFPKLRVEIDVDLSNSLITKLAKRRIAIALLPGPVPLSGATMTPLGSCSLRWLAHPQFLPARAPLTPEQLADIPIITLGQDANAYVIMEQWFATAKVKPKRVSYCNSFSALSSLVRNGVGACLVPEVLFRDLIEEGAVVVLPEKPRISRAEYAAVYLPTADQALIPQLATFAREESWFLRPDNA
jgi:DNA-binding transcriptional LysR family regulator